MSSVKELDIENRTYYFSDDIINIKNFDLNEIKTDKKSYKDIDIYYIGNIIIKNLTYAKINSGNSLYLIINKITGYIEESNRNNYLTLVSTDENIQNYRIKLKILSDQ